MVTARSVVQVLRGDRERRGPLAVFGLGMAFAHSAVGDGFRVIAVSRFGHLRAPLPPDPSSAPQADAFAAALTPRASTVPP
jgi:hypothetical protein